MFLVAFDEAMRSEWLPEWLRHRGVPVHNLKAQQSSLKPTPRLSARERTQICAMDLR